MIAVYGRMGYAVITSTFAYSAAYAAAAQPFWRTRVPARPRRKAMPSGVRIAGRSLAGTPGSPSGIPRSTGTLLMA